MVIITALIPYDFLLRYELTHLVLFTTKVTKSSQSARSTLSVVVFFACFLQCSFVFFAVHSCHHSEVITAQLRFFRAKNSPFATCSKRGTLGKGMLFFSAFSIHTSLSCLANWCSRCALADRLAKPTMFEQASANG